MRDVAGEPSRTGGRGVRTIAIVDDSTEDAAALARLVDGYFCGDKAAYKLVAFRDGLFLLEGYAPVYDLIFLDVEMRLVDGLDCARQLRTIDADVPVVYTTRMAQYAVKGYEVGAMGYLVKPVNPYALKLAMDRAFSSRLPSADQTLWLNEDDEKVAVRATNVDYVEVLGHDLSFHCSGRVLHEWGTLKDYAERLRPLGFSTCNRYCLVNLLHVERLRPETVVVAGDELEVSRRNRKRLREELMDLYQRGGKADDASA